ncbi:hypothetical protein F5B21DRAFT_312018 [Xylaria acuta]|nr:hypothetical protein F5B21DRAFT_312018 [Xylaria acuta]
MIETLIPVSCASLSRHKSSSSLTRLSSSGSDSGTAETPAASGGTSVGTGSAPADTSQSSPVNNHGSDDGSGNGGLTTDQKIALGVGIGMGVPAVIVAILAWWWPRKSRW